MAFVSVAVMAACATNPATGKRQFMLVSEGDEVAMGRQADADVRKSMGVYGDQAVQQYVNSVGQRLARGSHRPNLAWSFAVVDAPAVNAFALPGGYIYITRGLMPFLRNEAELAAVLGHEIGHVDARHSAAQMSKDQIAQLGLALGSILAPKYGSALGVASAGLGLAFLKFSRAHELEADQLGTSFAAQAGWNPAGMTGLLDTLGRLDEASGSSRGVPNWALTHPPAADRVTKVQEAVAAAQSSTATATNKAELERHLDGVVFGDSREKGMVRGNEFVHPVMRFALTFPSGWEIANTDEAVVAQPAGNDGAGILLQLVPGAGDLRQTADDSMARGGFQPVRGGGKTVNGLAAYVGSYQGLIEQTRAAAQAGFVKQSRQTQVFRILGIGPESQWSTIEPAANATIGSFRELSQQEADRIQNARVVFQVARSGDTWASLAGGRIKPATLAIMNGSTAGAAPQAGARIRTVQ